MNIFQKVVNISKYDWVSMHCLLVLIFLFISLTGQSFIIFFSWLGVISLVLTIISLCFAISYQIKNERQTKILNNLTRRALNDLSTINRRTLRLDNKIQANAGAIKNTNMSIQKLQRKK